MKYTKTAMYKNGLGCNWRTDEELSIQESEADEDVAEKFMQMLEIMGYSKQIRGNQIIYFKMDDCRHATEYVFKK